MAFIHQYNRLNTVPLCFGIWAQVAWTYAYIEYRHPEHSLGLVLEYLSTQVLSLSTHNKYLIPIILYINKSKIKANI